MRQLDGRSDPTDLRDVAADEVDAAIDDQVVPFSRVIKQFAQRQRDAALLTHLLQPGALLWR
ncbi:hypothetical protein D3C76_1461130 [compost metagenome]